MRQISQKNRKAISSDLFFKTCARHDGECRGKVTIEHTIIFAGRQLDKLWSLIPLCEFHHAVNRHQDGPGLNKEINLWIALNRATDDELQAISKVIPYARERDRLNVKYGVYKRVVLPAQSGINY